MNYRATKKVINYIQEVKPNIIHSNVGPIDIGYKAAKKLRIPHVWHIREYQDLILVCILFLRKKVLLMKLRC